MDKAPIHDTERQAIRVRAKKARLATGGSTEKWAELMGVSVSTLHRWESPSDPANPSAIQTVLFCKLTGISPSWLLMGQGVKFLSDIPVIHEYAKLAKDRAAGREGARVILDKVGKINESIDKIQARLESLEK